MYQILISNGFAPQNIILMAYNDIVNNAKNPFKGKIFNMKLITSVYPGDDKIDYKGDLVTGNNFINVITGRKTAQVKKVLTSTANDNVFIYYCDHGAKGLVAMPTGGCLTGHVLRQAVLLMKQKKMFKKLFIAIEACYSGSVGEMLNDISDVNVITAANNAESSYASFDLHIIALLPAVSNQFSHQLFKSFIKSPAKTIDETYEHVKSKVSGSHVMLYGDKKQSKSVKVNEFIGKASAKNDNDDDEFTKTISIVSQLNYTKSQQIKAIEESTTIQESAKGYIDYIKTLEHENISLSTFKEIATKFVKEEELSHDDFDSSKASWTCYSDVVEAFRTKCGEITEFEYDKLPLFNKICLKVNKDKIIKQINKVCQTKKW